MTGPRLLAQNLLLSLALLLAGCGAPQPQGPVILAASSLQEVLEAAADDWEEQGHPRPVLSFAASSAVARQADEGAPADLVITADEEWMDWLEQRELLECGSRRVVAGNSLMLVSAEPGAMADTIAETLAGIGNEKLAIADPGSVPAGRYARSALQHMALWDDVQEKLVPAENVRAALALVERKEARFGIVYATDARSAGKLAGKLAFDFRHVPEIRYSAAMLARSGHGEARAFLGFLASEPGMTIFADHGFVAYEVAK